MHPRIVNYRMENISESDFIEANKEFAQMMADVPGLVAKLWLRGPDEDGYGGVWQAATRRFSWDRCPARLGPGARREALQAAAHRFGLEVG